MTELDVTDGFDVHEYRSKLKLLRQDGQTMHLENREGLDCPACGGPFDRLFVTERSEVTFDSAPNGPMCLVRTPEQLLVLTH
jgi:hypothetical protein